MNRRTLFTSLITFTSLGRLNPFKFSFAFAFGVFREGMPFVKVGSRNVAVHSLQSSETNDRDEVKVAIIGGGIAGLSCAQELIKCQEDEDGVDVSCTVFDTGRLRPGGRCSSRLGGDSPKQLPFKLKGKGQGKGKGKQSKNRNNKENNLESSKSSRANPRTWSESNTNPLISSNPTKFLEAYNSRIVDHAAQIITVTESESPFGQQIKQWEQEGIIRQFPKGSVCEILKSNNANKPFQLQVVNEESNMYYGTKGMGSIPQAIAKNGNFCIEQDVWVSPSNGVAYTGTKPSNKQQQTNDTQFKKKTIHRPQWRIKAKGQTLGSFDRIIIAHNGKCADRLMSRTPSKSLHSLLRVNFAPTVPQHGGRRMTLNSIYSLAFAVRTTKAGLSQQLGKDVISAFVKNEPSLRFLSCNTKKYRHLASSSPRQETENSKGEENESEVQVWTLLSSPKFASRHKAPQENLPPDVVHKVTILMLEALESSLGLAPNTLVTTLPADMNQPGGEQTKESGTGNKDEAVLPEKIVNDNVILETRLQLWGAAVPLNVWSTNANSGFLYDATYGVGACGDWLLDPSIEGAWESGRRMARHVLQEVRTCSKSGSGSDMVSSLSVGLPEDGGGFVSSASAREEGIGSFSSSTGGAGDNKVDSKAERARMTTA